MVIMEDKMKKRSDRKSRGKARKIRSNSVGSVFKEQKFSAADTALELVEVYEAVERTYRAAVIAGETQAGVAYSTNY
jgi:UDP-N-acetylenolpyruvoylglucosamine reductase